MDRVGARVHQCVQRRDAPPLAARPTVRRRVTQQPLEPDLLERELRAALAHPGREVGVARHAVGDVPRQLDEQVTHGDRPLQRLQRRETRIGQRAPNRVQTTLLAVVPEAVDDHPGRHHEPQ